MNLRNLISAQQALASIKSERLSGKPIYSIARNLAKISPVIEAFQKKRDSIIKEIAGGKNKIEASDVENIEKFTQAMEVEYDSEIEIKLLKVTLTESQLEGSISPHNLSVLLNLDLVEVSENVQPQLSVVNE